MLVGTFSNEEGRWVEVICDIDHEALARGEDRAVVCEQDFSQPARECALVETDRHDSIEDAIAQAEARVLARGGVLGQSAGALANARVSALQARDMFSEPQLADYIHVPIAKSRRG